MIFTKMALNFHLVVHTEICNIACLSRVCITQMKKHTKVWFIIFLSLFLGLLIYTGTRTDRLFLNQFLVRFGAHSVKIFFSGFLAHSYIPLWMIYSLPDALWMLALMLFVMMIWDFKLDTRSLPWIIGAMCAGLFFEIAQGLHLIKGTFDVTDMLFIFIGASLPILFTLVKFRLWKIN